ncbi:DUF4244 domain-containing protein [Arthrobacter celericrescens]|uniref:DUF4244 domain-containing protein n=1 Tax=Arthrobacter celericrescens TaxID=2320851 RepID=UPI001FE199F6|nr:DUF4244 domain-containing protein [Arthrobacter celericrescens]
MNVQTVTRPASFPDRRLGGERGGPDRDAGMAPAPAERAEIRTDRPMAEEQGLAAVVELFPGSSRPAGEAPGSKRRVRAMASELGMATAEYAIATLAAVGFAGVLVVLLRSEEVRSFLLNLIRTALALP